MTTSGTSTQKLTIPRQTASLPFKGAPELPPFDLDLMVMPPNHFHGESGAVISFSTTAGYIGALRYRADNTVGAYLYTDRGIRVDTPISNGAFLPYAVTGELLLDYLQRSTRYSGISIKDEVGGESPSLPKPTGLAPQRLVSLSEVGTELGLSREQIQVLATELKEVFDSRGTGLTTLNSVSLMQIREYPFLPEYATLIPDPGRSSFVFMSEGSVTIYKTTNQQGVPLEPEKWKRIVIPRHKIDGLILNEFPWLLEYTERGKPVPGHPDRRIEINANGEVEVFKSATRQRIFGASATHFTVEPLDFGNIYFSVAGDAAVYRIQSLELSRLEAQPASTNVEVERIELPRTGEVTGLSFDPRGNFLLVRIDMGNGHEDVVILDQASMRLAGVVPEVAAHSELPGNQAFEVDGKGNVVFADREGNLRLARSSMATLARGSLRALVAKQVEAYGKEQERLQQLSQKIESLTTPSQLTLLPDVITPHDLERQMERKLSELFDTAIAEAQTREQIDALKSKLTAIGRDPTYRGFESAFETVHDALVARESTLVTTALKDRLIRVQALLQQESTGWSDLIEAGKLFERIVVDRAKTVVRSHEDREAITQQMREIQRQLRAKQESALPLLDQEITTRLQSFSERVGYCSSVPEVDQLATEESPAALDMIAALSDTQRARELTIRWRQVADTRRREIVSAAALETRRAREEQMAALEQLSALRESIRLELSMASTPAAIQKIKRTSPLMTEYTSWMGQLSASLMQYERERLDALFEQRGHRIASTPQFASIGEGKSWHDLLPVFTRPDIVWAPELQPLREDRTMARLIFRDNFERLFDPEHDPVPMDPDSPLVSAAVERTQDAACEFFEGVLREVPTFSEDWVINAFTERCLARIGKAAKQQLRGDNGLVIVRSEAGLGKNVMFDIFACLTHRSLMTFSCNANTEVDDLTFMYQYDPSKRGTFKLNSQFLQRLQMPGSIILLDEVNSLPAGVKKVLNSLFDYRRTLYLPDGRRIQAHPSTIFIGLENGVSAAYQGVSSHSMDLVSRARVIELEYPTFQEESGYYTPYEAELYAKQLPIFKGISSPDFARAWDEVINASKLAGAVKALVSPERASAIKLVQRIVQTAQAIRRLNHTERAAGQTGYVFTPRDGRQVVAEIRDGGTLYDAVLDVVLPKIEDLEYRNKVKAVIQGVLRSPQPVKAAA